MQSSPFKELSDSEIQQKIIDSPLKPKDPFVLFSTQFMGFTKNPRFLQVPMDDHGFHRGDGVFEAIKAVNGKPYLLSPHVDRLWRSAAMIDLKPPVEKETLHQIVHQAIGLLEIKESLIRIFVTRGPGGFSVNTRDCPTAQCYVIVMKRKDLAPEKFKEGVRLGLSEIPWKPGFFSQVKSLNYLPNVLMKSEANEKGYDFMTGVDDRGFLTEGPTENLVVINKEGVLCHPGLRTILKGCTMTRLFDLVEEKGLMKVNREALMKPEDLHQAQEVFMVGTTLDVLPVSFIDGRPKSMGPWGEKLLRLVQADQV